MPERDISWGFFDIAIVFAINIIISGILYRLIGDEFLRYTFTSVSFFAVIILYLNNRFGVSAFDLGFDFSRWPKDVVLGLSGAASLFVLVNVAVAQVIAEPKIHPIMERVVQAESIVGLAVPLIMAAVLAPIVEETFYRGMVFNVTRKRFGLLVGALLAGIFFAVFHLQSTWLEVTIVGIGLCFLYEWSGDLLAPILAHSVLNTLQILVTFWRTH